MLLVLLFRQLGAAGSASNVGTVVSANAGAGGKSVVVTAAEPLHFGTYLVMDGDIFDHVDIGLDVMV